MTFHRVDWLIFDFFSFFVSSIEKDCGWLDAATAAAAAAAAAAATAATATAADGTHLAENDSAN